jgi:hypothetical protein
VSNYVDFTAFAGEILRGRAFLVKLKLTKSGGQRTGTTIVKRVKGSFKTYRIQTYFLEKNIS